MSAASLRHISFEKHLDNLLIHVSRTVAADGAIASYDRGIANPLVETAEDRMRAPTVRGENDQNAVTWHAGA
jgi:hypothetical protein